MKETSLTMNANPLSFLPQARLKRPRKSLDGPVYDDDNADRASKSVLGSEVLLSGVALCRRGGWQRTVWSEPCARSDSTRCTNLRHRGACSWGPWGVNLEMGQHTGPELSRPWTAMVTAERLRMVKGEKTLPPS